MRRFEFRAEISVVLGRHYVVYGDGNADMRLAFAFNQRGKYISASWSAGPESEHLHAILMEAKKHLGDLLRLAPNRRMARYSAEKRVYCERVAAALNELIPAEAS